MIVTKGAMTGLPPLAVFPKGFFDDLCAGACP